MARAIAAWILAAWSASSPAAGPIEFEKRVLEFKPSRADLTVGIAIINVLAPESDLSINGAEPVRQRDVELKQVGLDKFEMPKLKFTPVGDNPDALCLGVKVWFNELPNESDSPFYAITDDRYALVSYCTKEHREARARHSKNRVATLEEFRERLKKPFALNMRTRQVPWRPKLVVNEDGTLYFHSFFIGRYPGRSVHKRGIWRMATDKTLEKIPVPRLARVPPWPNRVREMPDERFAWLARWTLATFLNPDSVAIDANGHVYVGVLDRGRDELLHRLAKFDPEGNRITLAGSQIGFADGKGEAAQFASISAITVGPDGTVYVADGNPKFGSRIRKVAADGTVTTLAGGAQFGLKDGVAEEARFWFPNDLALAKNGDLYIADPVNNAVRVLTESGKVKTVVKTERPSGAAIGLSGGEIYVLEARTASTRVRKLVDGQLETLVVIDDTSK